MKKHIYYLSMLALGAAGSMGLGGCTAAEPDAENLYAENETWFVSSGLPGASNLDETNGETNSPLNKYNLTKWGDYSETGRYSFNYSRVDNSPLSITIEKIVNDYNYLAYTLSFEYSENNLPNSVEWFREIESGYFTNKLTSRLSDIQWQDSKIIYCEYNEEFEYYKEVNDADGFHTEYVTDNIKKFVNFDYDNYGHLINIKVEEEFGDGPHDYIFSWNEDGDLTELNSPEFGKVSFEYYAVDNIYGQWDPSLPIMGPMQYFGWFGIAPKHFVKSYYQTKEADDYHGFNAINDSRSFNYQIGYGYNYNAGLIVETTVKTIGNTYYSSVSYDSKY